MYFLFCNNYSKSQKVKEVSKFVCCCWIKPILLKGTFLWEEKASNELGPPVSLLSLRAVDRQIQIQSHTKECRQLKYLDPHKFRFGQTWHCCHPSLPIHPLSIRPFICYPTIHSFMQSTSLPADQPTHHWSNDWPCTRWINTLLNGIIVSA